MFDQRKGVREIQCGGQWARALARARARPLPLHAWPQPGYQLISHHYNTVGGCSTLAGMAFIVSSSLVALRAAHQGVGARVCACAARPQQRGAAGAHGQHMGLRARHLRLNECVGSTAPHGANSRGGTGGGVSWWTRGSGARGQSWRECTHRRSRAPPHTHLLYVPAAMPPQTRPRTTWAHERG